MAPNIPARPALRPAGTRRRVGTAHLLLLGAILLLSAADRQAAAADTVSRLPMLSAAQQRAVGIVIAAAPAAAVPQRIDAYGEVLDPSELVADAGRLDSSRALDQAAAAETARLRGLFRGANASLKALQAAEATQTQAQVRTRQARTEFRLRWGPLVQLSRAQRSRLLEQLAGGRQLLLRANLLGRHTLGALPKRALVDVDGVQVPARVLGALPQTAQMQSVGLLLLMPHPPRGLGPGARLPVLLDGRGRAGRVVPDGALLYGEQGAYVYRALPDKAKVGETRFAPLRVTPLQAVGGAWLVSGLHADDRIVIQGAGVLWSLQGLGRISGGDD